MTDSRHSAARLDGLAIPSSWVRRYAHLVPASATVLDLAAGGGRHTRFFLQRGNPVTALDQSLGGMADLVDRPGIELIQADWEREPRPLGGRCFGAIIVTNYLHRPLLADLAAMLMPAGVLIYETFAVGQEVFGRPTNPDFLLQPNELIAVFAPVLTIVAYEHGVDYAPQPKAIQRIAAVKTATPVVL